jgi:hypothetical protein
MSKNEEKNSRAEDKKIDNIEGSKFNPFRKLMNNFRINFIGKPFELNKLVNDYSCLLENKDEANLIIKATRIYKGWQYLGQALSFSILVFSSFLSKKMKLDKSKQVKLVLLSFLPGGFLYFYSHFTYWHIVRDLVKATRQREKKYEHLDKTQIEDYKIYFNQSKDYHKLIQANLGLVVSIKEIFNN